MKCPYCNSDTVLRSAYYVYHTKDSNNWGNMWVCSNFPKCDSFVRCHKGTDIPLAECHIGMFDVKQCQRVISICMRQNNPIISEYREKHFRQREVFTRGYNNHKSNNDYSIF